MGPLINHHTDRAVDPKHLEMLGKQAARMAESNGITLTDAVVDTLGHEKLNSEQVRRVVETANVEAYNRKFASLQAPMRAVTIDGGPADPVQVLQSLNDAARPQEVTIETMEYAAPPSFAKAASAPLPAVFRTKEGRLNDVVSLRSKLASAHEEVVQRAEGALFQMQEAYADLLERAKLATLQGAALDELYEAWGRVDPAMAKVAADRLQHLLPAGTKVANRRINSEHPVIREFAKFANHARAHAQYQQARQELEAQLSRVDHWIAENR